MKSDSQGSRVIGTAGAFVLAGLWLWWMIGRRFSLTFDEGIYVDGARRMLAGQVPYRDFFIVMGPGTFWLQALALRVFGMTLGASHAVLILDLAVLAACVFWLVSRRLGVAYAAWTAAVMLILETAIPGIAIPSHRWDSAALAMLAITICVSNPGRWAAFAAGCCAGFAVWTTPPVALVGLVILIWLWMENRANVVAFMAAAGAISLGCAGVLAAQGAIQPMLAQLLWNSSNYSRANYLPYGTLFGRGYSQFFEGATTYEMPVRALVVLGIIVPILLPPIAALCFPRWRGTPALRLLFFGGAALVASTYPRMDLPHLTYAAPVFYALLAIMAASIPWSKLRTGLFAAGTLVAMLFAWSALAQHFHETALETNVGTIRAAPEDAAFVRDLQRSVPRASSLFVFPYLPIASFLTLTTNPTRYSYLQPGMMGSPDEAATLGDLRRCPPERVLYFDLSEKELLETWPASNPVGLRFHALEAYFSSNYHQTSAIQTPKRAFDILRWNEWTTSRAGSK